MNPTTNECLTKFKHHLNEMQQLNHVITLLCWDMRTTAPVNGTDGISDALAYFSTKHFELATCDELGLMLDELSSSEHFSNLDDTYKFIVTKMKKEYDKEKRIPKYFYEEFVRAQTASEIAWEKAKNASDYSIFAPHL